MNLDSKRLKWPTSLGVIGELSTGKSTAFHSISNRNKEREKEDTKCAKKKNPTKAYLVIVLQFPSILSNRSNLNDVVKKRNVLKVYQL